MNKNMAPELRISLVLKHFGSWFVQMFVQNLPRNTHTHTHWQAGPTVNTSFAKASAPLQGPKSPKSGKEGFGVRKLPFPNAPAKGDLSRKIPIFLVERIF